MYFCNILCRHHQPWRVSHDALSAVRDEPRGSIRGGQEGVGAGGRLLQVSAPCCRANSKEFGFVIACRLSVGIEEVFDLLEDFKRALDTVGV